MCVKRKKVAFVFLIILWSGIILDNALWTFSHPRKYMPARFGNDDYQQCITWILHNAKPGDIVVSQIHSYMFLMRGQYNIPYHFTSSPNEIISFLDFYNAKYLMISPFYQRPSYSYMTTVRKTIDLYPDRFKRVFGNHRSSSSVVEYLGG